MKVAYGLLPNLSLWGCAGSDGWPCEEAEAAEQLPVDPASALRRGVFALYGLCSSAEVPIQSAY